MNKKIKPTPKQIEYALISISKMGDGIKPENIDWANIGKISVSIAKETLRSKCKECGR